MEILEFLEQNSPFQVETFCDPRTNEFDDSEILEVLADITNMIHNEDCSNVLIAGDLNCHFARNTSFTRTVRNHFQELNLSILWEIPDCRIQSVDFTNSLSVKMSLLNQLLITLLATH